ncbi:MAG: hypothetical protein Q9182_005670 [Xanthomendoza sp. 2 TL-2023]
MDRFMLRPSGYRSICAQCRTRLFPSRTPLRHLSTTTPDLADRPDPQSGTQINAPDATTDASASVQQPTDQSSSPSLSSTTPPPDPLLRPGRPQFLESINQARTNNNNNNAFTRFPSASSSDSKLTSIFDTAKTQIPTPPTTYYDPSRLLTDFPPLPPPHHLHVYATKHNTHITLTNPVRDPIFSVSCGTIGFRKAARGTYDAAYQLGAYVMGRIQQQGLLAQIQHLEVVLRDFGPGREAMSKILLGSEGRNVRGRVVRVCDSTRLKFGGTRSKKPRRL